MRGAELLLDRARVTQVAVAAAGGKMWAAEEAETQVEAAEKPEEQQQADPGPLGPQPRPHWRRCRPLSSS